MNIIVTTPSFGKYNPEVLEELAKRGYTVQRIVPFKKEQLLEEIENAVALVVGLEKIDGEILGKARNLKVIAKHGVGVDNIDLAAARDFGIRVANSPRTNTQAVADLAFGFMLSLARSIPIANHTTKNGEWLRYDGVSVWRKTIGIIGLGAIGRAVAKRATGFDMKILGYDVTEPTDEEKELGIVRTPLEELLAQSDFVTLHVPLLPETKGMIGEKELQRMKPGAFLINTARGGIVDEEALYRALVNKTIAGAGIDAFETEPPVDNPLLKLDNVIATPHMGAYTIEANNLTSELTVKNVLDILNGKGSPHIIV